eukprot:4722115-Alexandrium_andersonii.AAC.1
MSASLVGSEMCIRDRCTTNRMQPPQRVLLAPRAQLRGRRASAGHRANPVSYTHLTLPTICSV